jgi:hypothetical protein
VLQGYS